MLRADSPLSDDQIRRVAPSIFADCKHESRSERYTYIPTIDVLRGLRNEGFQPFMVCQTRVRHDDRREYTKHMLRLRHADQITGEEANEIVLLNSHDGTSSYQMLAGMLRFVCQNGMVAGDNVADIRVPHKGNIVQNVINGAFDVLDGFDLIREQKEGMRAVVLDHDEQHAFARSALALRYDPTDAEAPAPVTDSQLLAPRRFEDRRDDLWTVFNRVQENLTKGGLHGRSRTGRSMSTRPITGIDQNVKLNRALWMLADAMRQMKA
ncbi:F plasmid protein 32 [Paraburkholderia phenoliruptrix BR3459a]|nr:F plasmid protein 32 [Paraburkholderia phenoliruptrix BR3459a]